MYDPKAFCEKVDERTFSVDPALMFPATVERILENDNLPEEIIGESREVAERFWKGRRSVSKAAYRLALQPYGEFMDGHSGLDEDQRELLRSQRSAALAYVESYFSRALSLAVGGGAVHIHIQKNVDYRR